MEKSGGQQCRTYGVNDMADKIQNAYEASKNIYDDVLTQGNFFSRMYMEIIDIYIVTLNPPTSRLKTAFFVETQTFYW